MKKGYSLYYKNKFDTQKTSDQLYHQLQKQLWPQPPVKPARSWRRAITRSFSLGMLGLAACVGIIYIAQHTVTDTVLNPKVALAQSIDNTFGMDQLLLSFGLGDPNEFRYRKMEVVVPGEHVFITNLELWAYQGSARADVTTLDVLGKTYDSYYLSQIDQRRCESDHSTSQPDPDTQCQSQQYFVKQQRQAFKKRSLFVPTIDQNWVAAIEVTPTLQVRFATNEPVSDVTVAFTGPTRHQPAQTLYNIPGDPIYYTNRLEGNLYWHSTQITRDTIGDGAYYIQFISGDRATPIYSYQPDAQALNPIDYTELLQQISATTLQKRFIDGVYQTYLTPMLFLHNHLDELSDPIVKETRKQDDQQFMHLQFALPTSYTDTVYTGYSGTQVGSHQYPVIPAYIDVWFNATTNQVLAYSLLDENHELLQEVELIENKMITHIKPEDFFTVKNWRATLQ